MNEICIPMSEGLIPLLIGIITLVLSLYQEYRHKQKMGYHGLKAPKKAKQEIKIE